MKLTIAASVLSFITLSNPSDAFTPIGLSTRARLTEGDIRTSHEDANAAIQHHPTANNVGRRRIKAWHRLELQPWSALRMSAAVDEPASTGIVGVNGYADGLGLQKHFTAEAIQRGIWSHADDRATSETREATRSYLSKYKGESAASIIYSKLQDHGVHTVNGYSGGAVLPLLDQFMEGHPRHSAEGARKPIRWITNSNEASAGHIAEGMAKSSTEADGKLAAGVVVATSGPGVTNLVTPITDAMCDGVPMIVMCGQAATNAPEAAFQSCPAVDILKPVTKWSYQITSASEVPFVMDYAFYVARHGRPGPVYLDLPKDMQNQVITEDGMEDFINGLEMVSKYGEYKTPFVKFMERTSQPNGVPSSHVIHLGSLQKGLPFEVKGETLEPIPLSPLDEASDRKDSFRMDHHITDTIYKNDGTEGSVESGGALYDLVSLMKRAKKPVILAGQGCNDASPELMELATTLQIPVTTTLHGLGCFDERHPLALNMLGMHGHATPNFMMQESDLIICIGSRFDDRITGNMGEFIPKAREAAREGRGGVIHVDVRKSEHCKQLEPTYFVHSTGKKFLQSVNNHLQLYQDGIDSLNTQPWLQKKFQLERENPVNIPKFKSQNVNGIMKTPMSQQHVVATMNNLLLQAGRIDDCIFTTGVGIHQMVSAQLITWTQPRQMLSSGSLGTMGVALGYSVGAKLANPQRMVIAVDGDGSFNMSFTELKTVGERRIPVKIMILDNESQMMVEVWQKLFFQERYIAVRNQQNPKYTTLADAFGIKNIYVDCEEDLEGAMKEFLFADPEEPVIMHVRTERTPCLPMVAPGSALHDMILCEASQEEAEFDAGAAPS